MGGAASSLNRHAELVSASTLQSVPSVREEEWTLKQVQGDGTKGGELLRITLASETDIAGWRDKARALLAAEVAPDRVIWDVEGRAATGDLLAQSDGVIPPPTPGAKLRIAKELLTTIETALLHRDEERFALAYDIVFRAQRQPKLHRNPADSGIKRLNAYAKSVRRDIHKMHAFVRFRKVGEQAARERFVAWFEPDHHITEAVAPFFRNRFTGMDWLIVTPEASIAWDGKALATGPGGSRADVPGEDAVEGEWRAYYGHIFNPARLKMDAMRAEMPVKYWKNLPEAELIAPLARSSAGRTQQMLEEKKAPGLFVGEAQIEAKPEFGSLEELYEAMAKADLPRKGFSDRFIPGAGPVGAPLFFVGEQPGDVEDQEGRAFVGPAGQLLDTALEKAGIDRDRAFVTNAVKRFRFQQRGKRRIHQTPTAGEIDMHRWWLDQERLLVEPKVIVALGSSAARALAGKPLKIAQWRGQPLDYAGDAKLVVTVHPSFLLRLPDEEGKRIEREKFVRDLELARELAA